MRERRICDQLVVVGSLAGVSASRLALDRAFPIPCVAVPRRAPPPCGRPSEFRAHGDAAHPHPSGAPGRAYA